MDKERHAKLLVSRKGLRAADSKERGHFTPSGRDREEEEICTLLS